MAKRFAVNVIGYVDDPSDKMTADQLEKMLNKNAVMAFTSIDVVAVVAQEIPKDSISISKAKVKKRGRFTQ